MKVPVKIVKAFTTDPHSGNPAGVIINNIGLDTSQMQMIAKQVGVSECVFITQNNGLHNLRYFSPIKEMDFCGHATIAAYHAIDFRGSFSVPFETRLGLKKINMHTNGIYSIHMGTLEQQYTVEDVPYIADSIGGQAVTFADICIEI